MHVLTTPESPHLLLHLLMYTLGHGVQYPVYSVHNWYMVVVYGRDEQNLGGSGFPSLE